VLDYVPAGMSSLDLSPPASSTRLMMPGVSQLYATQFLKDED
jgi:hypothetical protein